MKALIFGINGQDGYYLKQLLISEGIDVVGVGRPENESSIQISDYNSVKNLVNNLQPEFIFHFAANSTTSHNAWNENHEIISTGTLNLLEAVKNFSPKTRVFLSGSGLQFFNTGAPIRETDPFNATSMYSVSRIQSVYAARYYRSLGLKIYVGYFFNHDSPLRSERHINSKIAQSAKRIKAGLQKELTIRNLSVKKEFGFAGDMVKAVWKLVNQDIIFETTIGTGLSYSIGEWVEYCFMSLGLRSEEYVLNENIDPEYWTLVSDPTTILSLGWKPMITFQELADLMLLANYE